MGNVKKTTSAKRAARQDHRRLAREKLGDLRARLHAAVEARKGRLKELREICRRQRLALRDSLKATRERGLREIAERAKAEHVKVQEDCRQQKAAAKKAGADAVAQSRAAMAAERKLLAARERIDANQKVREETFVREHDAAVANHVAHSAMLGLLGPLYERVRPTTKGGETRSEKILKYAEAHPEQVHAILHPAVDESIAKTRAEIAAVERANAGATPLALAKPTGVKRKGASRPKAPRTKATTVVGKSNKEPAPTRKGKSLAVGVGAKPLAPMLRGKHALATSARAANEFEATHGVQIVDGHTGGLRWDLREGAKSDVWTGTRAEAEERARRFASKSPLGISPVARPYRGSPEVVQLVKRKSSPETAKAPELHDTADVAKRIRQDIATAVKERRLPKATYSVRTSKYSMGSSITVEASKLPFPVINSDAYIVPSGWSHVTFDSANFRSRFTAAARDVEATLNAIIDQYHWDQSDLASDYHHVRFHRDVRMTEDGRAFKAMEAEKVAAARAETGARK